MIFAPETQTILDRVGQITKTPIQVSPDLQSPYLLAHVKMARAGSSAHVVRYKPNVPGVNYNIAFQCAFILRLYENPPGDRYDFRGLESGRQAVLNMVKGPGGLGARLGIKGHKLITLPRICSTVSCCRSAPYLLAGGLTTGYTAIIPGFAVNRNPQSPVSNTSI